jgi:septal ring factor EnvC (AmiA/AmiB activator)
VCVLIGRLDVQLADEAERKAAEDRRRSEAEAYQRQLADRMAQEQAELNEIRKQREALQKKLQAFESEKRAAYQSPAKQSESSNPKVKVVAAAAPPVPSLSRNNSGSSVGSGSGSGKLPDAFSVKPPGAAGTLCSHFLFTLYVV